MALFIHYIIGRGKIKQVCFVGLLRRQNTQKAMWKKTKNLALDILFPKACLSCGAEGDYLCQDCQALLEISGFHRPHKTRILNDLYFPLSYQNILARNLIQKFKYEPFIKELAQTFSDLIISHLQLQDNQLNFSDFIIVPVPLAKKRLKWRGFNQSEELAKYLGQYFKIPCHNDVLIKTQDTLVQADLEERERKENIKNAFLHKNPEKVKGKKILLVDDVYTTGSTMDEVGRILKNAGTKEITGIVIARG